MHKLTPFHLKPQQYAPPQPPSPPPLHVVRLAQQQGAQQKPTRQQSVQLHMQLLVHASQCTRTTCQWQNCAKMKALLKHGGSCNLRASGGCQICRRTWALLQIHARHCKTQNKCPVPRCRDLKDHLRQLRYAIRSSLVLVHMVYEYGSYVHHHGPWWIPRCRHRPLWC